MLYAKMSLFVLSLFLSGVFSLNSFAETIDGVSAIVNNRVITESEVGYAMKERGKGTNRREVLESLIDRELLNQIVEESKIEVSDDELQNGIANVLRSKRLTPEELMGKLRSQGISYEDYKKQIKDDIKHLKFIRETIWPQVKITERDLLDFYSQNQGTFQKSFKARIARIVIPLPSTQTEEEMAKLSEKTSEMEKMIKAGKPFETLGENMGEVEVNKLAPPLPEVISRMSPGEVSPPILTKDGVTIIKLLGLGKLTSDAFEKIKDNIYDQLFESRVQEEVVNYLQKKRRSSYIEIR